MSPTHKLIPQELRSDRLTMSWGLEIGAEFAGYRVEALLGQGGMGVVYLAEHLHLGRRDALKVLLPQYADDPAFHARFIRESRLAASIEHPSIIPIYSAGEANGLLYISMRYVRGADLKTLLERGGRMAPGEALRVVEHVGKALDAAHLLSLVHRDVKPANILISDTDRHVYLTDFGIAKGSTTTGLTRTGSFLGTIDYCAPEQIEGKPVDGRTDLYALGCVFFECLTGRTPFPKDTEVAVIHAHLTEPVPALTTVRPDLPSALDGVVATAMAKYPEVRFSTCDAFVESARSAIEGTAPQVADRRAPPIEAPTLPAGGPVTVPDIPLAGPPAARAPSRKPRRVPWRLAGGLAGLALAGTGAVVALIVARGEPTAKPPKEPPSTSAKAPAGALPKDDVDTWPQKTFLASLRQLPETTILSSESAAPPGRSVSWVQLATTRSLSEVWRDVREQWLGPLSQSGYVLPPYGSAARELEGAAVSECLSKRRACFLWRRARTRVRLSGGSQVSSADSAQILVRTVKSRDLVESIRHPTSMKLPRYTTSYTELEIAVSGHPEERQAGLSRTIALTSLLKDPLPSDPPQEGRCFGPYGRASFKVYGSTYYQDFIQCGDYGHGNPGRANGDYAFNGISLGAGSRLIGFGGTFAIDGNSSRGQVGSVATWTVLYYGRPICRLTLPWRSFSAPAQDIHCAAKPRRGVVYEADTRAFRIQQRVSLSSGGQFWAGVFRPEITVKIAQ